MEALLHAHFEVVGIWAVMCGLTGQDPSWAVLCPLWATSPGWAPCLQQLQQPFCPDCYAQCSTMTAVTQRNEQAMRFRQRKLPSRGFPRPREFRLFLIIIKIISIHWGFSPPSPNRYFSRRSDPEEAAKYFSWPSTETPWWTGNRRALGTYLRGIISNLKDIKHVD